MYKEKFPFVWVSLSLYQEEKDELGNSLNHEKLLSVEKSPLKPA